MGAADRGSLLDRFGIIFLNLRIRCLIFSVKQILSPGIFL